jgi:hypothetical protein
MIMMRTSFCFLTCCRHSQIDNKVSGKRAAFTFRPGMYIQFYKASQLRTTSISFSSAMAEEIWRLGRDMYLYQQRTSTKKHEEWLHEMSRTLYWRRTIVCFVPSVYSGTKPVAHSVPGHRHEWGVWSSGVVASGHKRNSILSEMHDNKGAIIT